MSNNPDIRRQLVGSQVAPISTVAETQTGAQSTIYRWRQGAAAAAIPLVTVADQLLRQRITVALLAATSLLFLLMHSRHAATGVRRTSIALALLTVALLPIIDDPIEALERGVRIGGLIASLLISVSLLSRSSLRVPRMRGMVESLFALPRHQRPLALGVGTQFLGGLLGLAGLAMMMEVAAHRDSVSGDEQIADFSAISRGYAALSLWSPMYSNMSIVLALYEGLQWPDVLPFAFTIAAVFIGLGAWLERTKGRKNALAQSPASSIGMLLREGAPIAGLMLCFVAMMVFLSGSLRLPISTVIILGAPSVAWLLNVAHPQYGGNRWLTGSGQLGQDLRGQTVIAGEVMLFIASGCAGTVFSQAIPASWSVIIAQAAAGSAYLSSMLVIVAIMMLSSAAIHPMLSAIVVCSSLTPALLGLPPLVHLCAVLVGWGLAIILTPFSVLSLMAARYSGAPILTISLYANLKFALLAMGSAVLVLGGLSSVWQQH